MPSMGGSATLISAPRYGDLTNVDTTGQADHQLFAWDATAGKYKPLTGVVGDGSGGETLTGQLVAGDPTGATLQFSSLYGSTTLSGGQAIMDDGDAVLYAIQEGTGAGAAIQQVAKVVRLIERGGTTAGQPALEVVAIGDGGSGHNAPAAEVAFQTTRGDGTISVRVNDAGGLGIFGAVPPTAKPAITGALSTVADAPAMAVLTSIIAALVGCGLASDGTT